MVGIVIGGRFSHRSALLTGWSGGGSFVLPGGRFDNLDRLLGRLGSRCRRSILLATENDIFSRTSGQGLINEDRGTTIYNLHRRGRGHLHRS